MQVKSAQGISVRRDSSSAKNQVFQNATPTSHFQLDKSLLFPWAQIIKHLVLDHHSVFILKPWSLFDYLYPWKHVIAYTVENRMGGSVYSLGWGTTQTIYTKTTLQTLGSVFWIENSTRTPSPTTSHSNSHKWDVCTAGSETQSQASRLWSTSELKTLKSFTAVLGTYKSRDRSRVGNWCPRLCKRVMLSIS